MCVCVCVCVFKIRLRNKTINETGVCVSKVSTNICKMLEQLRQKQFNLKTYQLNTPGFDVLTRNSQEIIYISFNYGRQINTLIKKQLWLFGFFISMVYQLLRIILSQSNSYSRIVEIQCNT